MSSAMYHRFTRATLRRWLVLGYGILALLAAGRPAPVDAEEISVEAATRFNTVCARCHEGECSGRLSFDLGRHAADDHIRRYVGEVSPDMRRDLHALLAYMKRACAYYPTAVTVPADQHWSAAALEALRNRAANAYFVRLGPLAADRYRATLRFDAPTRADVQLISESFEIADHPGLRAENGIAELRLDVEEEALHHLRVQTDSPVALLELKLMREPDPLSPR